MALPTPYPETVAGVTGPSATGVALAGKIGLKLTHTPPAFGQTVQADLQSIQTKQTGRTQSATQASLNALHLVTKS